MFEPLAHETIDGTHERGKGFARSRWRGNEYIAAGIDCGPGVGLRRSRRGEVLFEPRADRGVEEIERHNNTGEWGVGHPAYLREVSSIFGHSTHVSWPLKVECDLARGQRDLKQTPRRLLIRYKLPFA